MVRQMACLSDHRKLTLEMAVLVATAIGAVVFQALREPVFQREPVYQGRALSSSVRQLDDGEPWAGFSYRSWRTNLSSEQMLAAEVIRSIGTNALPFLSSAATRKDSSFEDLPYAVFGNRQQERAARKKRLSRSWDAALALYALGPAAKPCLPRLKQAYYDYGNDGTARNAAVALVGIGPSTECLTVPRVGHQVFLCRS
jgi:hypothetical protein